MTQSLQAIFFRGNDQERIDYTPSGSSKVAGEVVLLGNGMAGVCTSPEGIADGALGSLATAGEWKFKKAVSGGVTFALGARIAWDDSGNTSVAGGGGTADIAIATKAAVDADDHVRGVLVKGLNVALNVASGVTALTDNSAGTANNTIEAMADIATAGGATPTATQVDTAVNAVLAKIRNNFADLAAKVNEIIALLKT